MSTGAELITVERHRQVSVEGYTPEHDAEHVTGEFVSAAIAYAEHAMCTYAPANRQAAPATHEPPAFPYWPWAPEYWKPSPFTPEGTIRDLVKAGALIAAEIDRLQVLNSDRRLPPHWQRDGDGGMSFDPNSGLPFTPPGGTDRMTCPAAANQRGEHISTGGSASSAGCSLQ